MKKVILRIAKRSLCGIAALGLAGMLLAGQAHADPIDFGFYRVTSNNAENVASQLTGKLWNWTEANAMYPVVGLPSDNYVLFTFTNNVGVPSSISEVYFDDGTILAQYGIHNSLGGSTDFGGPGANPGNLPSGNTVSPSFVATVDFSVDAQGNPSKGVDTSTDILGISFQLQNNKTYIDTVSALLGGEDLRVGMHLRSIGAAGGSDSFVNGDDPDPICLPGDPDCQASATPEPATMLLLGTGLIGFAGVVRRRKKNQA